MSVHSIHILTVIFNLTFECFSILILNVKFLFQYFTVNWLWLGLFFVEEQFRTLSWICVLEYISFIRLLVHVCIVLDVYIVVVVNYYFAVFAFLEKGLDRFIFRFSSGLLAWAWRFMNFLFFLIFLNWRKKALGWIYRSCKLCVS